MLFFNIKANYFVKKILKEINNNVINHIKNHTTTTPSETSSSVLSLYDKPFYYIYIN